jgi:hypothetical protein
MALPCTFVVAQLLLEDNALTLPEQGWICV